MNEDPLALLPELLLLLGAAACLLTGAFVPRDRQWVVRLLAAAVLLGALVASALALPGAPRLVYSDSYAVDTATGVTRLIVCASTLLVLALCADDLAGQRRESEAYVLMLLAATGSIALAGATDLLVLFLAFLLASIPLYALVGLLRDRLGAEAALKYYLAGALLGIVMLLGIIVLFGAAGRTDYAGLAAALPAAPRSAVAAGVLAVTAGLLFKAGGVPVHQWVPDVADGASTPAAAFVTTVPRVGALVALLRLGQTVLTATTVDWRLIVAIAAAASMTLGNLAAFSQERVKRLLAYSTISQVGYLLLAVVAAGRSEGASRALLFYLAAYAVTNLTVFAVVAALPDATTLADYAGLASRHRALVLALVVGLLGLVGTPPLAVLVGKVSVFAVAWSAGYAWRRRRRRAQHRREPVLLPALGRPRLLLLLHRRRRGRRPAVPAAADGAVGHHGRAGWRHRSLAPGRARRRSAAGGDGRGPAGTGSGQRHREPAAPLTRRDGRKPVSIHSVEGAIQRSPSRRWSG